MSSLFGLLFFAFNICEVLQFVSDLLKFYFIVFRRCNTVEEFTLQRKKFASHVIQSVVLWRPVTGATYPGYVLFKTLNNAFLLEVQTTLSRMKNSFFYILSVESLTLT